MAGYPVARRHGTTSNLRGYRHIIFRTLSPAAPRPDEPERCQGPDKVQHKCNGGCPWRSLVKSPGTRLGGAQCRRSREFPLSEAQRAEFREFERSERLRTGRRFHTASERDIPHYRDQCLILTGPVEDVLTFGLRRMIEYNQIQPRVPRGA
jgi:hypothetical protein